MSIQNCWDLKGSPLKELSGYKISICGLGTLGWKRVLVHTSGSGVGFEVSSATSADAAQVSLWKGNQQLGLGLGLNGIWFGCCFSQGLDGGWFQRGQGQAGPTPSNHTGLFFLSHTPFRWELLAGKLLAPTRTGYVLFRKVVEGSRRP